MLINQLNTLLGSVQLRLLFILLTSMKIQHAWNTRYMTKISVKMIGPYMMIHITAAIVFIYSKTIYP